MELEWELFSAPYEMANFIKENNIKRENIQAVFLNSSDDYELFYWK